nr:class I adenylate-forming enzyme family protein [Halomicroarcula sp. ZS-22-S1]
MTSESGGVTNLGAVYDATARVDPSRVAVIDDASETSITYGELSARVARIATNLEALHVDEGDRVALCYPNGVEYLAATLAVARIGAVPVPVNLELSREKLSYIFDDCGSRLVLVSDESTVDDDVASGLTRAEVVETVAVHSATTTLSLDPVTVRTLDGNASGTDMHTAADVAASTPAMQPYTSGSTGRPKGVVLTHGGIEWCTKAFVDHLSLDESDRGLVVTPLYHKNAMTGVVKPMLLWGSVVVLREFDSEAAIEAIASHEVTYMTGVPAIYKRLVTAFDGHGKGDVESVVGKLRQCCGPGFVGRYFRADFRRGPTGSVWAHGGWTSRDSFTPRGRSETRECRHSAPGRRHTSRRPGYR